MITRNKIINVLSGVLFCLVAGCYNDNKEDLYPAIENCDTTNITYSGFIAPLMNSSCAISTCHDAVSAAHALILDTHFDVQQIALDGSLLGAVTHAGGYYPMPKSAAKLDDCTIAKIRAWVNAGAPDN